MPFYEFDLDVPAGTLDSAPASAQARLNKGVIAGVTVMIPRGVAGLVSSFVTRGGSQVWPTNPGGRFKGDETYIQWDDEYLLEDEPTTFLLRGYAPDAVYPHKITFRFEWFSLEEWEKRAAGPTLLTRIGRALGIRG